MKIPMSKAVKLLYGKEGIIVDVPQTTDVIECTSIKPLDDVATKIIEALNNPIGCASLEQLLKIRKPETVAVTVSDITRPVPNKMFMPHLLKIIKDSGINDSRIVIVIGTGMHRPSTPEEREILLGSDIINRIEVIDHLSDRPETLVKINENPSVSLCARFARADFKIVTGYIEPHFMAGFSGGRKGVCPALVDLQTIKKFHGYETLANARAENGVLEGNPCHEIAMKIAKTVGVDFLFNVTITKDRKVAGIYCGDLEKAHLIGCKKIAKLMTVNIDEPYDLVITNGGGYPLDLTFYQTTKGMCTAMPALKNDSTMLIVSHCGEQLGSTAYTDLMLRYANNWQKFLKDISVKPDETQLDQWAFHMHTRVLKQIGLERLWFVSDGIPYEIQKQISVNPILGLGNARQRTQQVIDKYINNNPNARIAIIPEGPYTMLK